MRQHIAEEKRDRTRKREKERERTRPSSPSSPPPFLPLTPRTPTRSGPRRHPWWAAASCWNRGRSSGRKVRDPPRCGWPGPGAGPGGAGPSSRPRCASRGCTAAGRPRRRWRRRAGPGPGWTHRLSTATSARRYAPRPGTVSERTSGGREEKGERGMEGKKKVSVMLRARKPQVKVRMEREQQRGWRETRKHRGSNPPRKEMSWNDARQINLCLLFPSHARAAGLAALWKNK